MKRFLLAAGVVFYCWGNWNTCQAETIRITKESGFIRLGKNEVIVKGTAFFDNKFLNVTIYFPTLADYERLVQPDYLVDLSKVEEVSIKLREGGKLKERVDQISFAQIEKLANTAQRSLCGRQMVRALVDEPRSSTEQIGVGFERPRTMYLKELGPGGSSHNPDLGPAAPSHNPDLNPRPDEPEVAGTAEDLKWDCIWGWFECDGSCVNFVGYENGSCSFCHGSCSEEDGCDCVDDGTQCENFAAGSEECDT